MFDIHVDVHVDCSSCVEYGSIFLLQELRSATRTSNKVNAMQFCEITKAVTYGLQLAAETQESGMPAPQSKRGMPKTPARIAPDWNQGDVNRWPSDEVRRDVAPLNNLVV